MRKFKYFGCYQTCFHVLSFVGSKWSSFCSNHKSLSPTLPNFPRKSVGWPTFPSNLLPFQNHLQPKAGSEITNKTRKTKYRFITEILFSHWVAFDAETREFCFEEFVWISRSKNEHKTITQSSCSPFSNGCMRLYEYEVSMKQFCLLLFLAT